MSLEIKKLSDKMLLSSLDCLVRKDRETTIEILLHLLEMEKRRLHIELGFPSLFAYVTKKLGYSEPAANRRIRAARAIRDFPEILEMLRSGEATLTTVCLFSRILSKENKNMLLPQLRNASREAAEAIVAYHCPQIALEEQIKPIVLAAIASGKCNSKVIEKTEEPVESGEKFYELRFSVPEDTFEALSTVQSLRSSKKPNGEPLAELFTELLDGYLEKHDPERRVARRAKKGAVKRVAKVKTKQKASRYIPADVRDEVLSRDGGRCCYLAEDGTRCSSRWNLQLDHIKPFALGGGNDAANLRTVCAQHNRELARKVFGKAKLDCYLGQRYWKYTDKRVAHSQRMRSEQLGFSGL